MKDYFRTYLSESGGEVDEAMIEARLLDTINRRPPEIEHDTFANDRAFRKIFDELSLQIDSYAVSKVPVVNFIIGPTGAGKTAFSKSLFSVCRRRFWEHLIIPSRVEFSKYDPSAVGTGASGFETDSAFFEFVRRCQLRDLLIYFFISGTYSYAEKHEHVAKLALDGNAELVMSGLLEKSDSVFIDDRTGILDSSTRGIFTEAINRLGLDRDRVLYKLSSRLNVRFLVSFDGFDSTKIQHFLFERGRNQPIHYLVRTLKGIHEKVLVPGMGDYTPETHYLAYLRDTTFARFRTEVFSTPGGAIQYPVYWIVPPPYPLLVQNAAIYMTGLRNPADNLSEVFNGDVVSAFDRAVFDDMELDATTHLPFVFGSSGRRMKYHIRHALISALHRNSQNGEFNFKRLSAGISAKSVWLELVSKHGVAKLPNYLILEDLYLNDSRQLIPSWSSIPAKPHACSTMTISTR
ncbi:MAG: hypothetical protein WDN24_05000 [Sphingomonas sp.]